MVISSENEMTKINEKEQKKKRTKNEVDYVVDSNIVDYRHIHKNEAHTWELNWQIGAWAHSSINLSLYVHSMLAILRWLFKKFKTNIAHVSI